MPRSAPRPRPPATARGRKNIRIDQTLLDDAKRVLGAATETEAITRALEIVVHNARVADGIRAIAGRLALDESRINDYND